MNYTYKIIITLTTFMILIPFVLTKRIDASERFFEVQSIDTVKYSRDVAANMNDMSFDAEIDKQVGEIAKTGASHIALGTPYDEEFFPFLARWVKSARKYDLNVWFRGNFSGWEGWFGYPKIDRPQHIQATIDFIQRHSEIFQDGDIFTSCPECENGGPGDPRLNGDVAGHRAFLIDEYHQMTEEFDAIGKSVTANYFSMNGDVAKLVMDRETTDELDGVVTIDHYVKDADTLMRDVEELQKQSGGQIVLGEIGAPIPDIHGEMTDTEQAEWIEHTLRKVIANPSVIGVNYWVNRGGSTELWDDHNNPKPAVKVLTNFYTPQYMTGTIDDDLGFGIDNVEVKTDYRTVYSKKGQYSVPLYNEKNILFAKDRYISVKLHTTGDTGDVIVKDIVMNSKNPSWLYQLLLVVYSFVRSL